MVFKDTESRTNPIGYSGVYLLNDQSAFLCRCGIKKDHRGHGLQLRLIRKRTKLCEKLGIKTVYTYTSLCNIHSSGNLISNKFKPCLFPDELAGTQLDVGPNVIYWKKIL